MASNPGGNDEIQWHYEYNDDGSRATPEDVAKWISQHDDEAELERAG